MAFDENPDDFLNVDEFAVSVIYSPAAYAAMHPSSKSFNIIGIFTNEYLEFNGIGGLFPVFQCYTNGEENGRLTYTANDGTQTDYYVKKVQNDGSSFYKWIIEEI